MRLILCLMMLLTLGVSAEQQQQRPVLHHRSEETDQEADQTLPVLSSGVSLLPDDASGEYELNSEDVIEITLDGGHLGGYLSRIQSSSGEKSAPMTFLFAAVTVEGRRFSFTTQKLHDQWYAFEGTIVRGPGSKRDDEGYYLLAGTLTEYSGSRSTPRKVSLKSMPTCVEESCQ
ncbi:MAG: hypothetical protein HIU93_03280 [Acidobacteria bacterium]|nr:hypothetical protein [Acidobacteriota bacterium]MBW4044466.1 hypothetical protein [Acidobacteriota bacterium]